MWDCRDLSTSKGKDDWWSKERIGGFGKKHFKTIFLSENSFSIFKKTAEIII